MMGVKIFNPSIVLASVLSVVNIVIICLPGSVISAFFRLCEQSKSRIGTGAKCPVHSQVFISQGG